MTWRSKTNLLSQQEQIFSKWKYGRPVQSLICWAKAGSAKCHQPSFHKSSIGNTMRRQSKRKLWKLKDYVIMECEDVKTNTKYCLFFPSVLVLVPFRWQQTKRTTQNTSCIQFPFCQFLTYSQNFFDIFPNVLKVWRGIFQYGHYPPRLRLVCLFTKVSSLPPENITPFPLSISSHFQAAFTCSHFCEFHRNIIKISHFSEMIWGIATQKNIQQQIH